MEGRSIEKYPSGCMESKNDENTEKNIRDLCNVLLYITSRDWSPRRGEERMRQEQYFLKMIKDIKTWIQEALYPLTRIHTEETTTRHNVVKLMKTKPKENCEWRQKKNYYFQRGNNKTKGSTSNQKVSRRQRNVILTCWENVTVSLKFYKFSKTIYQELKWNEDILRQTKIGRIYHEWSNIKRNTKSIYTGSKKVIQEMQEGIESNRKDKYGVKLKYIKKYRMDWWLGREMDR